MLLSPGTIQSSSTSLSILVPAVATTRFVRLRAEYQVTTTVEPPDAGVISGGGWHVADATATFRVAVNPGFRFVGWGCYSCPVVAGPDPLTIAVTVDSRKQVNATLRVTTGPLPRTYTLTNSPALSGSPGGALNSSGSIAGFIDRTDVREIYLWQPERPNAALGAVSRVEGISNPLTFTSLMISGSGRLLYQTRLERHYMIWTPSSPGSTTGRSLLINNGFGGNSGTAAAFNRFGQFAGVFGLLPGFWTPIQDGAGSGFPQLDRQFGSIQAMNDCGQVLSEGGNGYQSPVPVGFRLFTPSAANSANGSFTWIDAPAGSTSVSTRAINSRGDVAGTHCPPSQTGSCQSRIYLLWQPTAPNSASGTTTDVPRLPALPGLAA